MKHIMIDLETLALTADACILSIGAVKFDDEGELGEGGFYRNVSRQFDRRVDKATIDWWKTQPIAAKEALEENKTNLTTALDELTDFFDHPDYYVWSKGAAFDIPIINHALKTKGMKAPWKYHREMCLRTMEARPWAQHLPRPVNPFAHNALYDAITQAKFLQKILAEEKRLNLIANISQTTTITLGPP